jgi:hypothetical protein
MAATVFTNNGYGVHSMIGIEKSARLYRYSWATTSTDANSQHGVTGADALIVG